MNALPDTGTSQSIVDIRAIKVTDRAEVVDGNRQRAIYAANKTRIPCLGTIDTEFRYYGIRTPSSVLVAKGLHEDLLISKEDQINMKILPECYPKPFGATCANVESDGEEDTSLPAEIQKELDALIAEFSDIFGDDPNLLKPMKGPPMKIKLREGVDIKPTHVTVARKTPIHQEEKVEYERGVLLKAGILREVTWPTAWISPSQFIPKPGNPDALRLVTDLRGLNRYIERPVMPFHTPLEVLARIPSGARYFLKLDMVKGYYQMELDQESADLTTFLLPTGRYQYTRGVMGCSATNDEFIQRTNVFFAPVKDLQKCVDDLLIAQSEAEVYIARARQVFEICRMNGITLSRKKLQAGRRVMFAGYVVSDKGVEADPAKLSAIRNFPTPTSQKELRSFWGLAQQLAVFTPEVAYIFTPFQALMGKNAAWNWLPDHDEAYKTAKDVLTSPPILSFFNPKRRTTLLTDAARVQGGLGFALRQTTEDGKEVLITCGSRTMSPAERRYSTMESEALGIQWAIKKCRLFLLGGPFTVFCDHKPLVPIYNDVHNKPITEIENPRVQRIVQKTLAYQFEVKHIDGVRNQIADALSRYPVFGPDKEDEEDKEDEAVFTCAVTTRLQRDPLLDDLRSAAASDGDYQRIVASVERGVKRDDLPPDHPGRFLSANEWDALGIEFDLLVLDGHRIVVPKDFRGRVLEGLHAPHAGIVRTQAAARKLYAWQGMNNDIKHLVEQCTACQELRGRQSDEPEQQTTASRPMEAVSADLWSLGGKDYLVVADRFSGWPWAFQLRSTDAKSVTAKLDDIFFEFGRPVSARADGGPQFRGHFERYCEERKIRVETSSPYNPRSNGHAEAAVKTVKHLLTKCDGDWQRFREALLEHRNTPRSDGVSPADRFFGRTQRTALPRLPTAYGQAPAAPPEERPQANPRARELPQLDLGARVRIYSTRTNKWDGTGTVTKVCETGRSYLVDVDEDASVVWRNRKFLKPLPQ